MYGTVGPILTNINVRRVEVRSVPCASTLYDESTATMQRDDENLLFTAFSTNLAARNNPKHHYLEHEWWPC